MTGEKLTKNEQNAVAIFKTSADVAASPEKDNNESFLDKINRKTEADKLSNCTYRSVAHVCPTSVVVERLFSQTKRIMTNDRKHMDPSTMEMCIMLKINKDLLNAETVDAAIDYFRNETRKAQAASKAKANDNAGMRGNKRTIDEIITESDDSDEDQSENISSDDEGDDNDE
jgi:hypothetical protein